MRRGWILNSPRSVTPLKTNHLATTRCSAVLEPHDLTDYVNLVTFKFLICGKNIFYLMDLLCILSEIRESDHISTDTLNPLSKTVAF